MDLKFGRARLAVLPDQHFAQLLWLGRRRLLTVQIYLGKFRVSLQPVAAPRATTTPATGSPSPARKIVDVPLPPAT